MVRQEASDTGTTCPQDRFHMKNCKCFKLNFFFLFHNYLETSLYGNWTFQAIVCCRAAQKFSFVQQLLIYKEIKHTGFQNMYWRAAFMWENICMAEVWRGIINHMAPNRVQSCNPGVVLTVLIVQCGSYARGSNWEGNWNENSDPLVEKCN